MRFDNQTNIKVISVSWSTAMICFHIDSPSVVRVEGGGRNHTILAETHEKNNIGRIHLADLHPDTEYSLNFIWDMGSQIIEFSTLPAPAGPQISSYAVIADPHISESLENRKGRLFVESASIFEAILHECSRQNVDFVLIAGDLTNRGTAAEYEMAASIIEAFDMPVLAVPGDHDRSCGYENTWSRLFNGGNWYSDIGNYCIFGLNTSENVLTKNSKQVLTRKFDPDKIPIVLSHVQLFPDSNLSLGTKHKYICNFDEENVFLSKLAQTPYMVYTGHQNIPSRIKFHNSWQISVPQPSQYICGYYLVRQFENGFYHIFNPIESEVLRDYSRIAGNMAAYVYGEPQWRQDYREGQSYEQSNFLISRI